MAGYRLSLINLFKKWKLELYPKEEVKELSLVWHYLDPWQDNSAGLHKLGTKFVMLSLLNGNQSLLQDLQKHRNLGFKKLQLSAEFKAYKPPPSVYEGAAEAMKFEPGEIAMVAAHLDDLKAARESGSKTIYMEEAGGRMDPDQEEYKDVKTWVCIWVNEDEDGFVEVARRRFDIRSLGRMEWAIIKGKARITRSM